jgi:hypothetical protein
MTRRTLLTLATLATALTLGSVARAADPNGTWKWDFTRQDGEKVEIVLKLMKAADDTLTGTITGPGGQETAIKDGKVKGDDVSFVVQREFNGNAFTIKYSGKVEGDTLKGKSEFEINGESRTRDFEAKRAK